MGEEIDGVAYGTIGDDDGEFEEVEVRQVNQTGKVLLLGDGRTLEISSSDVPLTTTWTPLTDVQIWEENASSTFPLTVWNMTKAEEVHGRWAA